MLTSAMRLVRNRKGSEAATELQGRWEHEIAVAIQRRKAAMIRAVLPDDTRWKQWLRAGRSEAAPTLPILEEVEEPVEIEESSAP